MANGYITPGDGALLFANASPRYVTIDARLPVQPSEWTGELTATRYRVQMWRQITIINGATVSSEKWKGMPATSSADTVTGAQAAVWIEYDATGQDPAKPLGESLGCVPFTSTTNEPRRISESLEAKLIYQDDARDAELLALCLIMENDNAFNTSTPISSADYEVTGRNTGVWAPYQANESYNAWLSQAIQIKNGNKILYETKQYWTVPL